MVEVVVEVVVVVVVVVVVGGRAGCSWQLGGELGESVRVRVNVR
jgi:hypothetical protein